MTLLKITKNNHVITVHPSDDDGRMLACCAVCLAHGAPHTAPLCHTVKCDLLQPPNETTMQNNQPINPNKQTNKQTSKQAKTEQQHTQTSKQE
jgi:hypothetical protein